MLCYVIWLFVKRLSQEAIQRRFQRDRLVKIKEKLEHYGIRGMRLTWLRNYLNDRSQCVHYSFIQAISIAPLQVLYYSEALPDTARVSRRSAEATVGKELAQSPYMAARAGVEPTTLRLKAIDSTKAPPCRHHVVTIKIGLHTSCMLAVNCGVPQGSI